MVLKTLLSCFTSVEPEASIKRSARAESGWRKNSTHKFNRVLSAQNWKTMFSSVVHTRTYSTDRGDSRRWKQIEARESRFQAGAELLSLQCFCEPISQRHLFHDVLYDELAQTIDEGAAQSTVSGGLAIAKPNRDFGWQIFLLSRSHSFLLFGSGTINGNLFD